MPIPIAMNVPKVPPLCIMVFPMPPISSRPRIPILGEEETKMGPTGNKNTVQGDALTALFQCASNDEWSAPKVWQDISPFPLGCVMTKLKRIHQRLEGFSWWVSNQLPSVCGRNQMQCKVHEQRNQFSVLVLPPGYIYMIQWSQLSDSFLVSKQSFYRLCQV